MEITQSPYVGPSPFGPKDSKRFFGRDQEADKLLSLITAHPVVLLYAPSGAGKTSLINAKLIPLLQGAGFDVLPPTRVQSQTQFDLSQADIKNIFAFNVITNWCGPDSDISRMTDKTLATYLKERKCFAREGHEADEATDEPTPRVVIFDQFEEIFRLYPERWKDRYGFFEQVSEALSGSSTEESASQPGIDPLLRVVFAMREDYIAGLDSYKHLLPEKLRTRFRLEHLREKSAKLAIEKPLEGTGRRFDDKVVDQLVHNLLQVPSIDAGSEWETGQYVEPVQLQVVCDNLWISLKPEETVITKEHLAKHGDVNQALSVFYTRSIESVAKETGIPESDLRTWFGTKLIRSEGVRDIVHRGRTHTAGLPNAAVEEFDKLHLIKGELRGREQWYELAHDRLIAPIKKSNEEWMLSLKVVGEAWRYLESRAQQWDSQDRPAAKLLDVAELHQAQRWRDRARAESLPPSKNLVDLIQASESAQSSRSRRRMTLAFAVLVVLLIAMSGVTVFAYVQRSAARRAAVDLKDKNERLQVATQTLTDNYLKLAAAQQELTHKNTLLGTEQQNLELAKQTLTKKNEELVSKGIELQSAQDDLKESLDKEKKTTADLTVANQTLESYTKQLAASKIELDIKNETLESQKKVLESQKKVLESERLARESRSRQVNDPELSRRLAVEAANTSPSLQAADALRFVLSQPFFKSVVLSGLDAKLTGAAFSPNGNQIITFGEDVEALLWTSRAGSWKSTVLAGHEGRITSAAFSPDGELVATSSDDKTVRLWKTSTGALQAILKGHTARVSAMAFDPNGGRIATEGFDKTGRIWDLKTGTSVVLEGLRGPVAAISFDRKGALLATEGREGDPAQKGDPAKSVQYMARIWNVADGAPRAIIKHNAYITALAFSPTGDFLITASGDRKVQIWATNAWETPVFSMIRTSALVNSISFSPNGEMVALTGGTLTQLLRLEQGKWTRIQPELRGHSTTVVKASFSRNGEFLVTASLDQTARIWDMKTRENIAKLVGHRGGVMAAAFSPTQNLVLTASQDKTARVWEFERPTSMPPTNPAVSLLTGVHSDALLSATFSKKGDRILTASPDRQAIVWDATTGKPLAIIRHDRELQESAFSSDGNLVVTSSSDGMTRIWDVRRNDPNAPVTLTGDNLIATLPGETPIITAQFSHNDKYVVTGGDDGDARIWQWEKWKGGTGPKPLTLHGHEGEVFSARFSPDDQFVVTAGEDGTARIWNAHTGTEVRVLGSKGDNEAYSADFSPDGKLVVTANEDDKARIWDVATGQLVKPLCGHFDEVYTAMFSPDGKLIVTASFDKTVRVWDYESGQTIALFSDHSDGVNAAAFSSDGTRIVTASSDRTARIYGFSLFESMKTLMNRADSLGLSGLTLDQRKQYFPECTIDNDK